MIVTRQKEFNEILSLIKEGPVFIIGCSECATLCHTGGEEEVLSMIENLKEKNIETTGWVILEPACHLLNDKRLLKQHKAEIGKAKKILIFACGNGAQTVSEIITDIDVIPGNDTLFLGEIKRASDFEKRCIMCGDCIQDLFEGLCPISRCPKGLLNGPCGGSIDGKCEVDKDIDCIWDIIYKRLKEKGQLREPKKWSKSTEMRRVL
jgi:ferredoxin